MKNKIVFVTGGTGFIGSHLVEGLLANGARVIALYRSIDSASYFATQHLGQKTCLVAGDVKDAKRILDIVTKYEVEYILHLAAQPIIATAYYNPLETLSSNILGTANILEAARQYGKLKGIIVASSDKAYGKSTHTYMEGDPLRGDHPYDVSKSAADLIAYAYYRTYKLPIVVTRFGNIYGPGDLNFNRIIPGIMKAALTGQQLQIRSDGCYIRDYVYVGDVVKAYLFLLKRVSNQQGEAFNVSSETSLSVLDVVKEVEKILHMKIPFTVYNTAHNETPIQHLDYGKIQKLGWKSRVTFQKGIKEAFTWYKKNMAKLFTP